MSRHDSDNHDGGGYFRVPDAIADNGWLAVLSPSELAVLLVAMRTINQDADGELYKSNRTVARLIGHEDHRQVIRAFQGLETHGLLTIVSSGGGAHGNTTRRRLNYARLESPAPRVAKKSRVAKKARTGGEKVTAGVAKKSPKVNTIKHTPEANRRTGNGDAHVEGFERFWNAWPRHPRKVNRAGCLRTWTAQGLEAEAGIILAGLEAAKRTRDWTKNEGEFIPAPMVWLNQRRWEALADAAKATSKADPLDLTTPAVRPTAAELADFFRSDDDEPLVGKTFPDQAAKAEVVR